MVFGLIPLLKCCMHSQTNTPRSRNQTLEQLSLGSGILGESVFFHHLLNIFSVHQIRSQLLKYL